MAAQDLSLNTQSRTALRDELLCPVCLDLYTVPVILPCSHILCKSCCEQMFEHSFIRCPVCRDRSYISGGLASLPRVRTLENVIDRCLGEHEHSSSSGPVEVVEENDVLCQLCLGNRKAHRSCQDCNASYCVKCLELSHPNRAPFSEHTLTKPKQNPRPKVINCAVHEERVRVYCVTCHVLACRSCVDLNCHPGHEILAISEAFAIQKELLSVNLRDLDRQKVLVQSSIRLIEDNLQDLSSQLEGVRVHIGAECDILIQEIESQRGFLIGDVEYEFNDKMKTAEDVANTLRRQAGKAENLVQYGRELLQMEDDAAFLQLSHSVTERVETCKGLHQKLSADLPRAFNVKPKVVDFRKERSMLCDLSYLTVPTEPEVDRSLRTCDLIVLCVAPPPVTSLVPQCPHLSSNVIDYYEVVYTTGQGETLEETAMFKVPNEARRSLAMDDDTQTMLVIPKLRSGTKYSFTVKALNAAGVSAASTPVCCETINDPNTDYPIPKMDSTLSRAFTSIIQIYSITPSQFASSEFNYDFLLMYRAVDESAPLVWRAKPMSGHGILDHRVFGLNDDTVYEFIVLLIGDNDVCQMSEVLLLTTGRSSIKEQNMM